MRSVARHTDSTVNNRRKIERLDNSFNKYSPDVVARPIDTFIRHQAPDMSNSTYAALASSLSSLSPKLRQLLEMKEEERKKQDEARGVKLYHESGERISWADYREKMPKLPGLNENVKNGYLKARMMNEANVARTAMQNAYYSGKASVTLPDGQEINISESDNPAAFNLWLNQFTKQYIKDSIGEDSDPEYFATIFAPQLEKAGQELASTHISNRNHVLMQRNVAEHSKIAETLLNNLIEDGSVNLTPESSVKVGHTLSELVKSMKSTGVPPHQAIKAIQNMMIATANRDDIDNGEDILTLARQIELEAGSGISLWDTDDTAGLFQNAAVTIQKNRHFKNERERYEKERVDKEAKIGVENTIADYALSGRAIPPELLKNMRDVYGVEEVSQLYSHIRNIKHGYNPDRGGGDGSGERALSKRQKAFDEAVKKFYQLEILNGRTPTMATLVNDPRMSLVTSSTLEGLISDVSKFNIKERDLIKDVIDGSRDIIKAELNSLEGSKPKEGEVSYLSDIALERAYPEIKAFIEDNRTLVEADPAAARAKVRDIVRRSAIATKQAKDALIKQGYDKDVSPSDPNIKEKLTLGAQEDLIEEARNKDKQTARIAEEVARRLKSRQDR